MSTARLAALFLLSTSSLALACGGSSQAAIPDPGTVAADGGPGATHGGTSGDAGTGGGAVEGDAGAVVTDDAGGPFTDDAGTGAFADTDASSGDGGGACAAVCPGAVLATGQADPEDLAVDDTFVYWANKTSGTISVVAKAGGAVKTLASGQTAPRGIALDDKYVYFTTYSNVGSVQRVLKAGGAAPQTIAGNQYYPYRIAVDGTTVYFTNDSTGGNLSSVAKTGGAPTVIAASQSSPKGVVVDGASLFFSTYQQVATITTSGQNLAKLSSNEQFPYALAADATTLYWFDEYANALRSVPKAGGAPSTLTATPAGHNDGTRTLALDGNDVFWNDRIGNTIQKTAKAGGVSVAVATASAPSGLATDGAFLYFANQGDGTIRKIAR